MFEHFCRHCGGQLIREHRRWYEKLLGFKPVRCADCRERQYKRAGRRRRAAG